ALQCRIGVATGLVVVGAEAGRGAGGEIAIAGEAPNLATGLQALAPPGAMVISDATYRQTWQLFECEALGDRPVGGFSAPVRAWRPLHEVSHLSRFRAARTVRTTFVGPGHELSLIADRWTTASEGTGRTVLILGEAGMGKSRLAEALHDHIREEPHNFVAWQCSPSHQTKALYPVVEYLTHAAGIVDADAPALRLTKLTELLQAAQMPLDGALGLFAQLLAIPPEAGFEPPALSPNQARAATIAALTQWMRRIAVVKPLLFVVEDAHWIDATTLELLVRLVGSVSDVPLLTVITARPEFASPWTGRAEVSIVGLDRLNNRDCEGLVREIAASAALQEAVVKEIVSRSDGNPLFVEELSAAMSEADASARRGVPDSLQSSLMARLDQLGDARQTAQVCSVLGRRFARPLLAQVANLAPGLLDADLSALVE
ncbi:MAG: ATP-binding protein, partial [Solirubrobacteraceae bacterium]